MLSNLPQELILEILSRIPIKDVCRCKSVCKSWLKQIETPELARSHLSKSVQVPGLLINHVVMEKRTTTVLKALDCSQLELDDIFINQDWRTRIECSINGLVFFRKTTSPEEYYICNPITRQYVKLPRPKPYYGDDIIAHYGFGVSSKSGQYKVVRMLDLDPKFVCQVYTLGGGRNKWRRIAPPSSPGQLLEYSEAEFLNGNLHWLAEDSCSDWVFCLDLETETFSKFPAPTLESEETSSYMGLGVLRRCLCCFCDDDSNTEIVIYTMSCYDKKSWVKECVIRESPHILGAYPIMIFGDSNGGVLMAMKDVKDSHLFCYSNTTNKRIDFDVNFNHDDCGGKCYFEASFYTPSFVSLGDSFKIRVIKHY